MQIVKISSAKVALTFALVLLASCVECGKPTGRAFAPKQFAATSKSSGNTQIKRSDQDLIKQTTSSSSSASSSSSNLNISTQSNIAELNATNSQNLNIIKQQLTAIKADNNKDANINVINVDYIPRVITDEFMPPLGDNVPFKMLNVGKIIQLPDGTPFNGSAKFRVNTKTKISESIYFGNFLTRLTVGNNASVQQTYHFNISELLDSGFDPSARTVIIVGGYYTKGFNKWQKDIEDNWRKLDANANIITVDWSPASSCYYYRNSAAMTPAIGRMIVMFLYYQAEVRHVEFMNEEFRSRIFLVGHSLGAHIVGFAGKDMFGQAQRITGLDPAGVFFDRYNSRQRLDKSDAKLVDVLHTNAGETIHTLWFMTTVFKKYASKNQTMTFEDMMRNHKIPRDTSDVYWGINRTLGHVDYYFNGGSKQPGLFDQIHIEDHSRAYELYKDALQFELATKDAYVKAQNGSNVNMRRYQIIAFNASTHKEFRTGKAWKTSGCSWMLLRHLNHKNTAEDYKDLKAYEDCLVSYSPIETADEFFKKHPKLKIEQQTNVNDDTSTTTSTTTTKTTNIQDSTDDTTQKHPLRQYFLDTQPKQPFLGLQFVLKLHMRKESFVDEIGDDSPVKRMSYCKLCVQSGNSEQAVATTLEIDPSLHLYIEEGETNFNGFAIPLNFVASPEYLINIDKQLEDIRRKYQQQNSSLPEGEKIKLCDEEKQAVTDLLYKIFPTHLKIASYKRDPLYDKIIEIDTQTTPIPATVASTQHEPKTTLQQTPTTTSITNNPESTTKQPTLVRSNLSDLTGYNSSIKLRHSLNTSSSFNSGTSSRRVNSDGGAVRWPFKTYQWTGDKDTDTDPDNCEREIVAIEVRPLSIFDYKFSAWFDLGSQSAQQSVNQKYTMLNTREEEVEHLKNRLSNSKPINIARHFVYYNLVEFSMGALQ